MTDNINHPSHYTSGKVECIDAIEASLSPEEFEGYLRGNVIKYIWRYKLKGKETEDLAKAEWYLRKLQDQFTSVEKEFADDPVYKGTTLVSV